MGYNLNKLMKRYGVGSASKLSYAGAQDPESEAYEKDQAAYQDYSDQYDARLLNTPMYADKQFQTQIEHHKQPQTREEMWEKYIGIPRPLEDYPPIELVPLEPEDYPFELMESDDTLQETTSEVTPAWIGWPRPKPSPLSDAARQLFLRDNAYRYADLGIRNTGNQLVMDQTGNYFGNILDAPTYQPIVDSTPVDDDAGDTVIDDTVTDNFVLTDPGDLIYQSNTVTDDTVIDDGVGNTVTDELGTIVFDDGVGSGRDLRGGFMDVGHITDSIPLSDEFDPVTGDYIDGGGGYKYGGPIRGYAAGDSIHLPDPSEEIISEIIDVKDLNITPTLSNVDQANLGSATRAADANLDSVRALLEKYDTATPYDDTVTQQRAAITSARARHKDLLKSLVDTAQKGPSESEKWARLAAAFGKPTKSGHFMENLALANEELANMKKEKRDAETIAAKLNLEGYDSQMELLQGDLRLTQQLQGVVKADRNHLRDQIARYENDKNVRLENMQNDMNMLNTKLSSVGQQVLDMGYTRGSTEFKAMVKKIYEDKEKINNLNLKKLQNEVENLDPASLKLKSTLDDKLERAKEGVRLLNAALDLNETAFDKTWVEVGAYKALKKKNPNHARVTASDRLSIILQKIALSQLKSTFSGGGISDKESSLLIGLQGLDSVNRKSRGQTMTTARDALKRIISYNTGLLDKVSTGDYAKKKQVSE